MAFHPRFALVALSAAAVLSAALVSPVRADDPSPLGPAVTLSPVAPKGAIQLFTGAASDLANNWYKRYSKDAPNWTVDGIAMVPNHSDITSKQEFGDCFLHVEFKCPPGHGNAGVGLQGRYEVQIYGAYGQKPEDTNAAALYSQKPARVIASKPSGEWERYDIIFRAPRFDAAGKVTEKPRVTVFQNGILVQVNNEFNGPTGIQYGEFKGMTPTGPLVLQGDHDVVQYRNVWLIPL